MDKLLYVAMSGAKETLRAQAANNHNLANANTTGFRADLTAFQSRAVTGPGFASRVYATQLDRRSGTSTGRFADHHRRILDVAVQGQGFIAVQDSQGNEAYTRAGDLHVDPNGQLMTATGLQVLGDDGPISVPPFSSAQHRPRRHDLHRAPGPDPADHCQRRRASSSSIRRQLGVRAAPMACSATSDGNAAYRPMPPCRWPRAPSKAAMSTSPTRWCNMIELSRSFELQIKAMHTAEDDGASATKLLQSS